MKLRRIAAFILAAGMAASALANTAFTVSAASSKLDSELAEAKKLGFITKEQENKLNKTISQYDAAKMAEKAIKKYYGKTGKYLPDRISRASKTEAASKYYLAATMFYSAAAIEMNYEYKNYSNYMNTDFWKDKKQITSFMPDAIYHLYIEEKGKEIVAVKDFADAKMIRHWTNPDAQAENMINIHINYGPENPVNYMTSCYDRVTLLPAMDTDSKGYFRPQKKMTVGDTARTLLRWYRSQEGLPEIVPLAKAGTYDKTIITDKLLKQKTTLPDADKKNFPMWHGINDMRMEFARNGAFMGGDKIFREGDIKAYADTGFNFLSIMISFSWLQGDGYKDGYVDKNRLKELDRVIALCMKYNIHTCLVAGEPLGFDSATFMDGAKGDRTAKLEEKGFSEKHAAMWEMLAKRYKGIDSKYLSFKLLNEPFYRPTTEQEYMELLGPSAKAIAAVDKDRIIIADMYFGGRIAGEEMAKLGVALCYHNYFPDTFCRLVDENTNDKSYIHSVKWPYAAAEHDEIIYEGIKKGTVIDAEDTFSIHMWDGYSINDVKATADKYGVGFIVGEFGIDFNNSPYRYTDETMKAYFEDMTETYEKAGIPWVSWNATDLMDTCPVNDGAKYTKLENSLKYYNEDLGNIFKKINGVPASSGSGKTSVKAASTAKKVSAGDLSAPENVKASAGDGKVTLSWNAVSGAEAYKVYQYDTSAKKYKAVKTVKGTKATVTGLKNGSKYKFRVAAAVKSGKTYKAGKASAAVSASPKKPAVVKSVPASNTKPSDYSFEHTDFKTKIDAFNGEVKELPLTEQEKKDIKACADKGVTVRKLSVDGITLYDMNRDNGKDKPILFKIHGGGGHKEMGHWAWAYGGEYFVVVIDCAGCGDSQDGPLQAPAAWAETVHDLDVLLEYYNTVSGADANRFALDGGSMGGNISLCYVAHGKYKPEAILISCATPENKAQYPSAMDCFDKGRSGVEPVWTEEELSWFLERYNPINYPERFTDVWVFSGNGSEDPIAPPEGIKALAEKVKALGGKKFEYQIYEGVGHGVSGEFGTLSDKFKDKVISR